MWSKDELMMLIYWDFYVTEKKKKSKFTACIQLDTILIASLVTF